MKQLQNQTTGSIMTPNNDNSLVSRTHASIKALARFFGRRANGALIVLIGAMIIMIAGSTAVALLSKAVFELLLENTALATTIAVLMHVGLGISIHTYIRGLLSQDSLHQRAGLIFTSICLFGLVFIAVARAAMNIQEGEDPLRAITHSFIYLVMESMVPAVLGFLSGISDRAYAKARWRSNKIERIKGVVCADNSQPEATWASHIDHLDMEAAEINEAMKHRSGTQYEILDQKKIELKKLIHDLTSAHPILGNQSAMKRLNSDDLVEGIHNDNLEFSLRQD